MDEMKELIEIMEKVKQASVANEDSGSLEALALFKSWEGKMAPTLLTFINWDNLLVAVLENAPDVIPTSWEKAVVTPELLKAMGAMATVAEQLVEYVNLNRRVKIQGFLRIYEAMGVLELTMSASGQDQYIKTETYNSLEPDRKETIDLVLNAAEAFRG